MMTICNIKVPPRVNNYATKRNVLLIRGQKISAFIDAYAFIKKGAQVEQSIKLLKLRRKLILYMFDNQLGSSGTSCAKRSCAQPASCANSKPFKDRWPGGAGNGSWATSAEDIRI
ncbi:hypothetical protein N9C82_02300 [bacterium]|nr:hypothetical protein [bacterium]